MYLLPFYTVKMNQNCAAGARKNMVFRAICKVKLTKKRAAGARKFWSVNQFYEVKMNQKRAAGARKNLQLSATCVDNKCHMCK